MLEIRIDPNLPVFPISEISFFGISLISELILLPIGLLLEVRLIGRSSLFLCFWISLVTGLMVCETAPGPGRVG